MLPSTTPNQSGSGCVASVTRVTAPNVPPAPPPIAPRPSRLLATVPRRSPAAGRSPSGSRRARRGDAHLLRPAAEAAPLHEPAGGSHAGAPAALDVPAVPERDLLVSLE